MPNPTSDDAAIEDILSIFDRLSDGNWLREGIAQESVLIQADAVERFDQITSQTPTKKKTGVFGIDTGAFKKSWLEGLEFVNGEAIRSTDLEYAPKIEALAEQRSPFVDGWLGVGVDTLDLILEHIGEEAERIWQI